MRFVMSNRSVELLDRLEALARAQETLRSLADNRTRWLLSEAINCELRCIREVIARRMQGTEARQAKLATVRRIG